VASDEPDRLDSVMSCVICGLAASGTAHGVCGGHLPADEREYKVAAATHIVRLVALKPGVSHRGPWTAEKLLARMRPELVPHFDDGLALAISAGSVRRKGDVLTPAPVRVTRRQRTRDSDDVPLPLF
jgi:hypothetical protein